MIEPHALARALTKSKLHAVLGNSLLQRYQRDVDRLLEGEATGTPRDALNFFFDHDAALDRARRGVAACREIETAALVALGLSAGA